MSDPYFFVPGIPRPKGSMKTFIPKHGTKPIAINDNPRTKPWQDLISLMATVAQKRNRIGIFPGPVGLRLHFFFEAKTLSTVGVCDFWHVQKPDLDKLVRAVKDALKGIFYKDDCQVCFLSTQKQYGIPEGVGIYISDLSAFDQSSPRSPV